jgi:hypothetical protein
MVLDVGRDTAEFGLVWTTALLLAGMVATATGTWLVFFLPARSTGRHGGFVFLALCAQGRLPGVFAIPAGAGDILIGVTAPLVAMLLWSGHRLGKRLAVIWNIAGIYDLLQAVALGFLTAPSRYQLLALNAPNFAIGAFPLVVIPAFAVPLSMLLHMASLSALPPADQGTHGPP